MIQLTEYLYWLAIAYLLGLAGTLWMFICAIDSQYKSGEIFKYRPGEFKKSWPAAIGWPVLWLIVIVHIGAALHLELRKLRKERKNRV